jgi:hypothetical protein
VNSGVSSSISGWWHQGETPNARIFRQRFSDPVLVLFIAVLVLSLSHPPRLLAAAALTFVSADCLLSLRRAIILTHESVIYRPPLGVSITVALGDILSVVETRTISTLTLIPGFTTALKISTVNGTEVFPLTVGEARELVHQVSNVIGDNSSHRKGEQSQS